MWHFETTSCFLGWLSWKEFVWLVNWLVPGSALNHNAEWRVSRDEFFFSKVTAFMNHIWRSSYSIRSDTEVPFSEDKQQLSRQDLCPRSPFPTPTKPGSHRPAESWEGQRQLLPARGCRQETKPLQRLKPELLLLHALGPPGSTFQAWQAQCRVRAVLAAQRDRSLPARLRQWPTGSISLWALCWGFGERAAGTENKRRTVGGGIWQSD